MSKKEILEHISSALNDEIYLLTRSIFIFGEITEELANKTLTRIHVLDNYEQGTINIFLNTEGGDVDEGMLIYDAIYACKNHVRMYIYGKAQSMGSIIAQAADERIIAPHATMMIHDGKRAYPEADHKEIIKNWDKYYDLLDEKHYNIYMEKIREKVPDFHKNKLTKMMLHDTILTAEEAIELGLADRLVERGEFKG